MRPNLTLRMHAITTRVVTEQGRAIGVEYLQGGARHRVTANAEVIIAAGAIHSPHLLMLSGIGPAEKLRLLGIPIVQDAPDIQFVMRSTSREAKPWWPGTRPNWTDMLGIIPSLLHPVSRGMVDVASADPLAAPRIDPGFLADSRDVDTLVAAVKIARDVLRQPSLDHWRGAERLRVIDASVMPDLVSGNINACVLMIAERAADLLRA